MGNWLLDAAVQSGDAGDRAAFALAALLADARTAPAVLAAPRARPRLLKLVQASMHPEKLASSATAAASSAAADAAAARARRGDRARPPSHAAARVGDVRAVADVLADNEADPATRALAASFLGAWADGGPLDAGKVAAAGGAAALAAAATAAAADPSLTQLRATTVAAMKALAASSPLRGPLAAAGWVDPLVYVVADAAADGDDRGVADALDALGAALAAGAAAADPGRAAALGPLLVRTVRDAAAAPAARRAACRALAAAAGSPAARPLLGEALLDDVADALVARLVESAPGRPPTPTAPGPEEQAAAARALAALAAGPGGRARAAAWLGELLVAATAGARAAGEVRDRHSHAPAPTVAASKAATLKAWLAARWRPPDAAAVADAAALAGALDGGITQAAAAAVASGGDDGDAWRSAVSVQPRAARGAADALRELFGRASTYQEPPADAEAVLAPAAAAAYPAAAAAVDAAVADAGLAACLHALAELVACDPAKQAWLARAGVVGIVQRLVLDRDGGGGDLDDGAWAWGEGGGDGGAGPPRAPPAPPDPPSLAMRRTAARLLAMAAATPAGARALSAGPPACWLASAAAGPDLPLASHATRALLAVARRGEPPPKGAAALLDGAHALVPGAPHHALLAHGPPPDPCTDPDAPTIDVVFVHGLRGGAFATWRMAGRGARRGAAAPLGLGAGDVWPSAWLSNDVPRARLLSVDYAAPASGWEGESLPLAGTLARLAARLAAARVGDRPVVFVCHSLGGVLVKELLAAAAAPGAPPDVARIGAATVGAIFYACPHRGSWLARVGWNLRFLGASPASSVAHLRAGAHLAGGDAALRAACEAGRVAVLSFGETEKLAFAPLLPAVIVVPPESASPGYGEYISLPGADHIRACKPASRDEPAYAKAADLIKWAEERAAGEAGLVDVAGVEG